jgi:death-on-curing protein
VTRWLTPEQVLFLHSRMVEETGGLHGVRDLPMLLSAMGRPQATFSNQELYPDIYLKAGALLDSLIRNHPFLDGNMRTALAAAAIFLRLNGFSLEVNYGEMVRFTLACAQAQVGLEEIGLWLRENSVSVE